MFLITQVVLVHLFPNPIFAVVSKKLEEWKQIVEVIEYQSETVFLVCSRLVFFNVSYKTFWAHKCLSFFVFNWFHNLDLKFLIDILFLWVRPRVYVNASTLEWSAEDQWMRDQFPKVNPAFHLLGGTFFWRSSRHYLAAIQLNTTPLITWKHEYSWLAANLQSVSLN